MKRMILVASHTAALLTGVGIMIAAVELGMVGSDSSAHQAVESEPHYNAGAVTDGHVTNEDPGSHANTVAVDD